MRLSYWIPVLSICIFINTRAARSQTLSGPGELGSPGSTLFSLPSGPDYSKSSAAAQWSRLGYRLAARGSQVVATFVPLPLARASIPADVQDRQNISFAGLFPNQIGSAASIPSGLINVRNSVFAAKGDGVTDDTSALQNAINAACATAGSEVYLPATPAHFYKITRPLLISCNLMFEGAGPQQTIIHQDYYGPALMVQGIDAHWTAPLTSNIKVTWSASHHYKQWQDIVDSNRNIEVQEASACKSGTSIPTWPTTQPRYPTALASGHWQHEVELNL